MVYDFSNPETRPFRPCDYARIVLAVFQWAWPWRSVAADCGNQAELHYISASNKSYIFDITTPKLQSAVFFAAQPRGNVCPTRAMHAGGRLYLKRSADIRKKRPQTRNAAGRMHVYSPSLLLLWVGVLFQPANDAPPAGPCNWTTCRLPAVR